MGGHDSRRLWPQTWLALPHLLPPMLAHEGWSGGGNPMRGVALLASVCGPWARVAGSEMRDSMRTYWHYSGCAAPSAAVTAVRWHSLLLGSFEWGLMTAMSNIKGISPASGRFRQRSRSELAGVSRHTHDTRVMCAAVPVMGMVHQAQPA